MLGVAIRIAQRMGIHNESALAKCTILEAEMRRRLWWSLILFDTRISEMADSKTATLAPTWDCRIPLNVSDSELRPEMKELPAVQSQPTEALFAVVRGELGEFVRHTMFHLDFASPALKAVAKNAQSHIPEGGELVALEKIIENKYLKFCDPENPLHFMTIWTTRTYLAKCRLVEHYSRCSSSSVHQTQAQGDAAISYALSMLECDTKILTSPLTKGFLWLTHFYFPFPAYIQLLQDLRRRPVSENAEQAWEVMSDNYEARFVFEYTDDNPFFKIFIKIVLQAWEVREVASRQLGEPLMPPRIVTSVRHRLAQVAQNVENVDTEQPSGVMSMGIDDFPMSMPIGFDSHSLLYGMGGPDGYAADALGVHSNITGQNLLDFDVNQLQWAAMDWGFVNAPAAEPAEPTGPSPPY
jgi:hypothetical protein